MRLLIQVRREANKSVVVLRPFPRWRTTVKLAATAVLAALLGFAPVRDGVLVGLFRVAMIAMVGISLYGGALASAWYVLDREIVTATSETLIIEHFIWRRRVRATTYSASGIEHLRAVGVGQIMHRGRLVSAIAPALAFDHQGKTVRFGAEITGVDAESVVTALQGQFGRREPSARS